MPSHLSWRDALLALAIVFVWGTNFVVIRLGLNALPPLFFATLRFVFVFLPAAFFLPRPRIIGDNGADGKIVAWSNLAIYGVCIGLFQFGLLFIAMKGQISPGLASLVVQMQVFFTIALAMWRTGEKIKPHQLAAFGLALAGMGVIAAHNGQGATIAGVALVLLAALGWAMGNQAGREAGRVNMLAYVVWAAMFSVPPLLLLSLLTEGPAAITQGIRNAGLSTWAAVLWQSAGNTMFGYACWAWLLSRYPAATVAPVSLLVPIFGFASSAILLGEPLPAWKIGATLLILAGLAVNLLWRPGKAAISGEAC
ncbi:MAG TPA: EamA family transporter [Rhizomicrobium sp.]|jgi:O-acetylserine/cysteine efflux transporter|nr:EamA family transporter [Rhizomicrobium sp.]